MKDVYEVKAVFADGETRSVWITTNRYEATATAAQYRRRGFAPIIYKNGKAHRSYDTP